MSKPETIKIDEVEYVRKDAMPCIPKVSGTPIGDYCIVRCRDAGVWAGVVQAVDGRSATLINARRLWLWKAVKGHTLSAVANYGISGGSIPAPVAVVYLTETAELIPCTEKARMTITEMKAHNE